MIMDSKPTKEINREYIIDSKELKQKLGVEGTITSMGLFQGRSINEIEEGKSPEKDKWYITTKEVVNETNRS